MVDEDGHYCFAAAIWQVYASLLAHYRRHTAAAARLVRYRTAFPGRQGGI